MEFCTESSKGKTTQPLALVIPACNGVSDGGRGLHDLLSLNSNLARVRKKQKYDSDSTICEIMVPVFYRKGRLSFSISLHIFYQSLRTGNILANKFRLDFTSHYLNG